jgi:tetratricopeptide (TPR) repeat protein
VRGQASARIGLAAAVVLVALAVRFGSWLEIRGTPLDAWHEWGETDMATYLEQARQLAAGDWLARTPHHPYHAWQSVAPPERWVAWYGPGVFHQAPLYAYAIALALRVADDPLAVVKAAQLALGAASALLAFAIALRLAGPLAATAAGLLLALYGPLVALEAQLLREGPAIFALLALLALLLRHLGPPVRGLRSAALLGVALGVFAMLHEVARVVAGVAAVALVLRHGAGAPRRALAPLAALAAGWLVGFAPLCARNVAVGAPPFSVSSRMLLNLVESNVAGAARGGASAAPPGAEVAQILDAAHGSVGRAVVAVAATYRSDPGRLLRNWVRRVAAICQRFEEADNVSYYFYREQTRALRWLPDFRTVFPLGVAGALAIAAAALATRPAVVRSRAGAALAGVAAPALRIWEREPSAHALVLGLGAAIALALSAVHVVARFRLYVVPFLAIEAGIAVAVLARALAERRTACAGGIGACALAAAGVQALATHPASLPLPRMADLDTAQVLALRHGDPELAAALAARARELDPHDPLYFARLAGWLEREGRSDEAARRYEQALELDPFSRALREALARTRAPR